MMLMTGITTMIMRFLLSALAWHLTALSEYLQCLYPGNPCETHSGTMTSRLSPQHSEHCRQLTFPFLSLLYKPLLQSPQRVS